MSRTLQHNPDEIRIVNGRPGADRDERPLVDEYVLCRRARKANNVPLEVVVHHVDCRAVRVDGAQSGPYTWFVRRVQRTLLTEALEGFKKRTLHLSCSQCGGFWNPTNFKGPKRLRGAA
jgi:hypothetical protein